MRFNPDSIIYASAIIISAGVLCIDKNNPEPLSALTNKIKNTVYAAGEKPEYDPLAMAMLFATLYQMLKDKPEKTTEIKLTCHSINKIKPSAPNKAYIGSLFFALPYLTSIHNEQQQKKTP